MGAFLIVIIGLSGCGKSYMIDYVLKNKTNNIRKMIAITTRAPRRYEKDGIDKVFKTEQEFIEETKMHKYCFVNEVYNNKYAFYRSDFDSENNFLCELYYKNYQEMKSMHAACKSIYIRPKSITVLETKLLKRGSSKEEIENRLQVLHDENNELEKLAEEKYFDYVITNDFLEKSADEFKKLVENILQNRRG